MSILSVIESAKQDYEEYINKQAKIIQWYEKENRHNQEIIIKDVKEIERLNNIINDFEEELEREINIKEEDTSLEHNTYIDIKNTLKTVLKRFRELKELKENK